MHHVRRDRYLSVQDLSSTRSIETYFDEIKRRAIALVGDELRFTEPNSSHGGVAFSYRQTHFQARAEIDGKGLFVFTSAQAPTLEALDPGLAALVDLDPRTILQGSRVESAPHGYSPWNGVLHLFGLKH